MNWESGIFKRMTCGSDLHFLVISSFVNDKQWRSYLVLNLSACFSFRKELSLSEEQKQGYANHLSTSSPTCFLYRSNR